MERADQELYADVLDLIARNSAPSDTILALPFDPEFYFLSDRRAPLRYFIASLGLTNERDYERAVMSLQKHPPKIVVFRRDDKYNTPLTLRLIGYVRANYAAASPRGGFDVFIKRD